MAAWVAGPPSPLEFATTIPEMMAAEHPYTFVHLPCVAPDIELLEWWRSETKHKRNPRWQDFRDQYVQQLPESAVRVAAAFVESAAARGGLAVLLCAEPQVQNFDEMPQESQDEFYCHRFTLASRIRKQLRTRNHARTVNFIGLASFAPQVIP